MNDNALLYLLFSVLFPLAAIFSIRKKSGEENQLMDRGSTTAWKGIFIITIFIHHYVQLMDLPGILFPYIWVGYIAVAGFFLFSGYGLMSSLMHKKDYMNRFLLQKGTRVYLPAVISSIAVGIIALLLMYGDLNVGDVMTQSLTLTSITRFNKIWYVIVTLIFYLFFFISFKWLPIKKGLLLLFALNSLYVILGRRAGLENHWINTAFLFPLGCAIAYNEVWLLDKIKRNYWKIATLSTVSFLLFFLMGVNGIVPVATNTVSGLFFGVLIAIFSVRFKLNSNVFAFFGTISFELYLVHSELFIILRQTIGIESWVEILSMFGLIVLLAYGLNKLISAIILQQKIVFNPKIN